MSVNIKELEKDQADIKKYVDKVEVKKQVITLNQEQQKFLEYVKTEYMKTAQSIQVYKDLYTIQKANAKKVNEINHKDIRELEGMFNNKTTLCIAFGPSIRDIEADLLRIKDKYKIIAVDRAFSWLMDRGIKPDVVLAVDANIKRDWIEGYSTEGIKLVSHIGAGHEFCKYWDDNGGDVYFFSTNCRIGSNKELENITGVNYHINLSGNVAQGVIVMANTLTKFRKLLLIGFDNSWNEYYYPDNKEVQNTKNYDVIEVEDIKGNSVFTHIEFLTYNYHMKSYIMDTGIENKVINCSGGGILNIPKIDKLSKY